MKRPPHDVTLISAGSEKKAQINKMFVTEGPPVLCTEYDELDYPVILGRLDQLSSLTIEDDLSTRKTHTVGESKTTAKTGNTVKRALIGGVLGGGAGAVIGGVTGTKDTVSSSLSTEEINYLVNCRLTLNDGKTFLLQINDPEILAYISSFLGVEPSSDIELEALKNLAERELVKRRESQRDRELREEARKWAKSQLPSLSTESATVPLLAFAATLVSASVYVNATDESSPFWWLFRLVFWSFVFAIPFFGFAIFYSSKHDGRIKEQTEVMASAYIERKKSARDTEAT